MTVTLTDFLLARIAEDEAAARDAALNGGFRSGEFVPYWSVYQWHDYDGGLQVWPEASAPARDASLREALSSSDNEQDEVARHIARHDPARVLADIEAKRRVVLRCAAVDYAMPSTHLAHGILSELALPYADHPDYRATWRP